MHWVLYANKTIYKLYHEVEFIDSKGKRKKVIVDYPVELFYNKGDSFTITIFRNEILPRVNTNDNKKYIMLFVIGLISLAIGLLLYSNDLK